MINKFLRKRFVTTFHFKSGKSITFTCSNISIKRDNEGNLTSYEIDKVYAGSLFYCDIKQVEAITYYQKRFLWG